MKYILQNCRFIKELTENQLEFGDILVEDGNIVKIAPHLDDECLKYDLNNKYVVPGFIDLHVHLTLSGEDVLYDNFKPDYYMTMMAYRFAMDSLKAGFTTIRDVGSNVALVNSVRDAINNDLVTGPTILSSGMIISPTENGNEYFAKMYRECDGEQEMIKGVREEIKLGADFIKIMASGAIMNPGGEPGSPVLSDEEVKSVVQTASLKGKYVAAHAHSSEAILQCIKYGVRTIEHASLINEEGISLLLNSNKTYIVPTISAIGGLKASSDASFINEKIAKFTKGFVKSLTNAYQQGLMMGFGSDQGISSTFHGNNADEFIYRKDIIGISNLDLLKQATINSAIIAKLDNELGDISCGKNADLVVLDKNPLDDIAACKNNVVCVYKKGVKING